MTLFKNKYRNESARLRGYDYTSPGLYFVTICAKNHECFFGDVVNAEMGLSTTGEIVADEWYKTQQVRANVELDEWVVMPNHLHGIIAITHTADETSHRDVTPETSHRDVSTRSRLQPNSLGAIMVQIDLICTKRIRAAGVADFDWQERFYDEIICNERALNAIRAYIIENPANWHRDKEYPVGLRM